MSVDHLIRRSDRRRSETPNAVMTTFASPSQGGAGHAMWRVDMAPGARGPLHSFDAEQIWAVVEGGATVELDGASFAVEPGDTVVLPAGTTRRINADTDHGFAAIVSAPAGAEARVDGSPDTVVPPWTI
ncbi:cupin domain-containing protein [Thermomonospora umbrina]|uniref:Quercetin dioxygenase-like cupin family protein n=1 Tax=Thermomonospora umbrina TaxID=111806 RepID=A0A3D9SR31_9ACTN|nr:cupin domain-containing protein [Thermomonospora umbrina]REE96970.1 quercetin dioxygenase-like cupin family protein [Thermomonospora umbrina]